ncbi:MAG: alpha/beta hydrolase [Verrucomicrobia bacterium]|nr:alpha/beta hydrolase [Verrucomicrobiota bacterium]
MKKLLFVFCVAAISAAGAADSYDPMKPGEAGPRKVLDFVLHDANRQRDLPVRVYLPKSPEPAPVVLFSHGLGGSSKGYSYLGTHWSGRGYVVVAIQHPGSDESVWRGSSNPAASMKQAAHGKNFMLRVQDIPAVIDQLALWNREPGHPLINRLDLEMIGMAGHSFGAVTTQGVSGETLGWVGTKFTDSRIQAALCLSPSAPRLGKASKAFGSVKIPWMLMTGTNDIGLIGGQRLASRLAVFPALPPGGKYELVLNGADHMAFSDSPIPRSASNPNHHKAIEALSTAFWDAYLKGDKTAKAWLDGEGAGTVLTAADAFQKK